jgi:hypothetical protein
VNIKGMKTTIQIYNEAGAVKAASAPEKDVDLSLLRAAQKELTAK